MGDDRLRRALEQLHRELQEAQQADPGTHDMLHPLQRDIETALHGAGEQPPHPYHGLRERLAEAVGRLEESHPSIALAMGAVLDHLANV